MDNLTTTLKLDIKKIIFTDDFSGYKKTLDYQEQIKLGNEFVLSLNELREKNQNIYSNKEYKSLVSKIAWYLGNFKNEEIFKLLQENNHVSEFDDYDLHKYENHIEFDKIHRIVQFDRYSLPFQNKYLNYLIEKKEFYHLDKYYLNFNTTISKENKDNLLNYILEKKDTNYNKIILANIKEIEKRDEEFAKKCMYSLKTSLENMLEFYDYNPDNPPLFEDYEQIVGEIDWDEINSVEESDVIDYYTSEMGYEYDKESETFTDENGDTYLLQDLQSQMHESNRETCEYSLNSRYEINDEDNFKLSYDNRGNKSYIEIQYYEEKTYDEVLNDDVCYNDPIFGIKYGEEIFKEFLKNVYGEGNKTGDVEKFYSDELNQYLANAITSVYTKKDFIQDYLDCNDIDVELGLEFTRLGFMDNDGEFIYDNIDLQLFLEKIDYDIKNKLNDYDNALGEITMKDDLYYDIKIIQGGSYYPNISLSHNVDISNVSLEEQRKDVKRLLDKFINKNHYHRNKVREEYLCYLNNYLESDDLARAFYERGEIQNLLTDNKVSVSILNKENIEHINDNLFYNKESYYKIRQIEICNFNFNLEQKKDFIKAFEDKILKEQYINYNQINYKYFLDILSFYKDIGINPYIHFDELLKKNNISFPEKEKLISKTLFNDYLSEYFLLNYNKSNEAFLVKYFDDLYSSESNSSTSIEFIKSYFEKNSKDYPNNTLSPLEEVFVKKSFSIEGVKHILDSKKDKNIFFQKKNMLSGEALEYFLDKIKFDEKVSLEYITNFGRFNDEKKNEIMKKVDFGNYTNEMYHTVRGHTFGEILTGKSIEIEKESFNNLFDKISFHDSIGLYYNCVNLYNTNLSHGNIDEKQEIISIYFKEYIEKNFGNFENLLKTKFNTLIENLPKNYLDNPLNYNGRNIFEILYERKKLYLDDVIQDIDFKKTLLTKNNLIKYIFHNQSYLRDITFINDLVTENLNINYDLSIGLDFDLYKILPDKIKRNYLIRKEVYGYLDINDFDLIQKHFLTKYSDEQKEYIDLNKSINYEIFNELNEDGKKKLLIDRGLNYVFPLYSQEQKEIIFKEKMKLFEIMKNENFSITEKVISKNDKEFISTSLNFILRDFISTQNQKEKELYNSLTEIKSFITKFGNKDYIVNFIYDNIGKNISFDIVNSLNDFLSLDKKDLIKFIKISTLKEKDYIVSKIESGDELFMENYFRIKKSKVNLESELKMTIDEFIDGGYKDSKQAKEIFNTNSKEFSNIENGNSYLEKLNNFDKVLQFQTENKEFNIQDIVSNLERSLSNQYGYLFGYDMKSGVLNGISNIKDFDFTDKNKDAVKIFDIALKGVGSMLLNTDKSIQLRLEGGKIAKSINELEDDSNKLINALKIGQEKIKDILTFKDYLLNVIEESDKHIIRKIKKDLISKLNTTGILDAEEINLKNYLFDSLSLPFEKIHLYIDEKIKNKYENLINSKIFGNVGEYFHDISIETLNQPLIKDITKIGFSNIQDVEIKKDFGKVINELLEITEFKKLLNNASIDKENNFFTIFEKLNENPKYKEELVGISELCNKNIDLDELLNSFKIANLKDENLLGIRHYLETVNELLSYYKQIKNSVITHLKDDFGNIDLKAIQENMKGNNYVLKLWNRDDVITNLNQGHFTHCCISPGGCNGRSIPFYIMSENFVMVNLYDEDKNRIIGQAFTYLGKEKSTNKINLVIDNVEINNNYTQDKDIIKEKIIDYMRGFRNYIGNLDRKIKIGTSYNDIDMTGHDQVEASDIIGFDDIYLDSHRQYLLCE